MVPKMSLFPWLSANCICIIFRAVTFVGLSSFSHSHLSPPELTWQ